MTIFEQILFTNYILLAVIATLFPNWFRNNLIQTKKSHYVFIAWLIVSFVLLIAWAVMIVLYKDMLLARSIGT